MADTSPFAEVGSQLFGKIFSGAIWLVVGLLVAGIIAFLFYWFVFYKKKFDIDVKIISQRAGDSNSVSFDKAAILTDRKTKTRYFRLWNYKLDLPIPKFDVLQRAGIGILQKSGRKDFLEIYQKSDEEFYYLTPPKISKTKIINADGNLIGLTETEHTQIETDMAYWNVKRKDLNKGMFDTDKLWMKLLELAPQILSIICLIFVLWIFLDKLPAILTQLQGVASEINRFRSADINEAQIIEGFLPLLFLRWKN